MLSYFRELLATLKSINKNLEKIAACAQENGWRGDFIRTGTAERY